MCQSYPDVIYKQFVPNRCTCIFKIKNMQVAFLIFKYFSLLSVQIWCILGMARNMPLGQHVGGDRTQPKPCYLLFFYAGAILWWLLARRVQDVCCSLCCQQAAAPATPSLPPATKQKYNLQRPLFPIFHLFSLPFSEENYF